MFGIIEKRKDILPSWIVKEGNYASATFIRSWESPRPFDRAVAERDAEELRKRDAANVEAGIWDTRATYNVVAVDGDDTEKE
jgi:hypothetical protein